MSKTLIRVLVDDELTHLQNSDDWIDFCLDAFHMYEEGGIGHLVEEIDVDRTIRDLKAGGCRIETNHGGYLKIEEGDVFYLWLSVPFPSGGFVTLQEVNEIFVELKK